MICPRCGGKVIVKDTIQDTDNNEIYRQRKCIACDREFYTGEFIVDSNDDLKAIVLKNHQDRRNRRKKDIPEVVEDEPETIEEKISTFIQEVQDEIKAEIDELELPKLPTMEDVEKIWDAFQKRVDRAEAHEIPSILYYRDDVEPTYMLLRERWDVHEAEIFIERMKHVYNRIGWDIDFT